MTENQKQKIDNFIAVLPEHDRSLYREIAEYAVSLGYLPSKTKNPNEPMVFAKNVENCWRRLCKISPPNPAKQLENTVFALAFYKVSNYSDIFHQSGKRECESRKSRVGVNGCGECGGYTYVYPCGKKVMCCHDKLIVLGEINNSYKDEILSMMKTQHDAC